MDIPLFALRPDLLDHPPQLVEIQRGRRALRFEAEATEATEDEPARPSVILYIHFPYGKVTFGYSFHYDDGIVEEWAGPYGDPDHDTNKPHGISER
jgi:hypothetical protein